MQVGQGLLALGRMTTANDEDLRDLHQMLQNLNLSTTQRGLRIRLECPVETVSRGIEQSGVVVNAGVNGREVQVGVGRKASGGTSSKQGDAPSPQQESEKDGSGSPHDDDDA